MNVCNVLSPTRAYMCKDQPPEKFFAYLSKSSLNFLINSLFIRATVCNQGAVKSQGPYNS